MHGQRAPDRPSACETATLRPDSPRRVGPRTPATPPRTSRGPGNPATGRSPLSVPVRSNWTKGAYADSGSPKEGKSAAVTDRGTQRFHVYTRRSDGGSTDRRFGPVTADVRWLRPVIPALARPEAEERRHSLRDGPAAPRRRKAESVRGIFMSCPGPRLAQGIGSTVGRSCTPSKRAPGVGQSGHTWAETGFGGGDRAAHGADWWAARSLLAEFRATRSTAVSRATRRPGAATTGRSRDRRARGWRRSILAPLPLRGSSRTLPFSMAIDNSQRWRVEDFFRTLTSGCKVECLRIRTADRLGRAIAICAVIAWRIMLMILFGCHVPEVRGRAPVLRQRTALPPRLRGREGTGAAERHEEGRAPGGHSRRLLRSKAQSPAGPTGQVTRPDRPVEHDRRSRGRLQHRMRRSVRSRKTGRVGARGRGACGSARPINGCTPGPGCSRAPPSAKLAGPPQGLPQV